MEHIKYPKLMASYLKDSELGYSDGVYEWEVTVSEKLHGANSGIYVNGEGEIAVASRKEIISEESLKGKKYYQGDLKNIVDMGFYQKEGKRLVKEKGYDYVIFYGELYGSKIFEMGYGLNKEGKRDFKVFNVMGVIKEEGGKVLIEKISYDEMENIMGEENLVPIEYRGKYKDAIREEISDLSKESNYGGVREGYVIMPTRSIRYEYDGGKNNTYYPIYGMKIKGEKFLEVSAKVRKETEIGGKKIIGLDGRYHELFIDLYRYGTISRIENVISHSGEEVSPKDIPRLTKELVEDILCEYEGGASDYEIGQVKGKLTAHLTMVVANYVKGI